MFAKGVYKDPRFDPLNQKIDIPLNQKMDTHLHTVVDQHPGLAPYFDYVAS